MSDAEIVRLDQVVETARGSSESYHEFLRRGMFSVGVYRLAAGDADQQVPHAEDEVYHVLSGRAQLQIEGTGHPVEAGSIAFVAKHVEHCFTDITEDLEVVVLFAPPETGE
jgi:mannose-6-phosphate isomerase-like protein (cupin superfamily)